MSLAIVSETVYSDTRLSAADLRVLLSLISFTSRDTPRCWPSRQAIGNRCNITSPDRISKIISRLKKLGWIKVTDRPGSNLYEILYPEQDRRYVADFAAPWTPVSTPGVDTGLHTEGTSDLTKNTTPLPPASGGDGEQVQLPLVTEPALSVVVETTKTEDIQAEVEQPAIVHALDVEMAAAEPGTLLDVDSDTPVAPSETSETVVAIKATKPSAPSSSAVLAAVERVVADFDAKAGTRHAATLGPAITRLISRRLVRYGEDALKAVVDLKAREWRGTDHERYLSPKTVWKPTAIETALEVIERQRRQEQARLDREAAQRAEMARPADKPRDTTVARTAMAGLLAALRGASMTAAAA